MAAKRQSKPELNKQIATVANNFAAAVEAELSPGDSCESLCIALGRAVNHIEHAMLCYRAHQAYLEEHTTAGQGKRTKDSDETAFAEYAAKVSGLGISTILSLSARGRMLVALPEALRKQVVAVSTVEQESISGKKATNRVPVNEIKSLSKKDIKKADRERVLKALVANVEEKKSDAIKTFKNDVKALLPSKKKEEPKDKEARCLKHNLVQVARGEGLYVDIPPSKKTQYLYIDLQDITNANASIKWSLWDDYRYCVEPVDDIANDTDNDDDAFLNNDPDEDDLPIVPIANDTDNDDDAYLNKLRSGFDEQRSDIVKAAAGGLRVIPKRTAALYATVARHLNHPEKEIRIGKSGKVEVLTDSGWVDGLTKQPVKPAAKKTAKKS